MFSFPYRAAKRIYLRMFNRKNGTTIKSRDASIHAQYGDKVLIESGVIVAENVRIGNYSYVNKNSSIENCDIGKYCSISSGVYICPAEHNTKALTTHPISKIAKDAPRARVVIGNDVLISLNCIILEGVSIGDGAVIAAGAVVTKDVRPFEIVGGVPARHISWRANPEDISVLEQVSWWDWEERRLIQNADLLDMPLTDAVREMRSRGLYKSDCLEVL